MRGESERASNRAGVGRVWPETRMGECASVWFQERPGAPLGVREGRNARADCRQRAHWADQAPYPASLLPRKRRHVTSRGMASCAGSGTVRLLLQWSQDSDMAARASMGNTRLLYMVSFT